jgi:hypothetical protein
MNKIQLISHIFTGNSLTVVYMVNGKVQPPKVVDSSHVNWKPVMAAFKLKDYSKVAELMDVAGAIKKLSGGKFEVLNGAVYYGGEKVHGHLFDRILLYVREGLEYAHLIKFAENLFANTSAHVKVDLFKFLEYGHMPITPDGCFLSYKGVQSDFYSVQSGSQIPLQGKVQNGKILNAIGAVIEVRRSDVNEDRSQCSSYGLHVGSHNYAKGHAGHAGKLLVVKVNPRDVVAVPVDGEKLRVVKYEVFAESNGLPLDVVKDIGFKSANEPKTPTQYPPAGGGSLSYITPPSAYKSPNATAKPKTKAIKVTASSVPNKGWANKRDKNGRFYKKHNL